MADVSPDHWRVQALLIKFNGATTLLINSYFPTDPQRPNADHAEFHETLGVIRNIIRSNVFDSLVWTGDLNSDFMRISNQTMLVNNAIEELQLIRSWDNFNVDFTHCYEVLGTTYVSVLDHFIWNESLSECIVPAGVIHH